MADIKIADVIERLDYDMKRALEDAVNEVVDDDGDFDRSALFRAFVRAVNRKCSTWVRVPDNLVRE